MKIAFCHHYSISFWSGGEKLLAFLAEKLASDGHEVEIHALPIGKRPDIDIDLNGVKYTEGWNHSIDADVAHYIYAPIVDRFFRTKNGTPKIASIHGFPLVPELQHKMITEMSHVERLKRIGIARSFVWAYTRLMRNYDGFDAIHVINPAIKSLFAGIEGLQKTPLYFIPNWVDRNTFKPCAEKNEEFTVLYASRNEWVKGIDIYDEISRKGKGIKFIATGDSQGSYQSIGFIKSEHNLARAYSSAHITVIPTRIDTFGNTIIESLACGTPVITTKFPVHEALNLPLTYADSCEEFVDKINILKNLWEQNTGAYNNECTTAATSIDEYDFKNVYPQYVKMFEEVSGV